MLPRAFGTRWTSSPRVLSICCRETTIRGSWCTGRVSFEMPTGWTAHQRSLGAAYSVACIGGVGETEVKLCLQETVPANESSILIESPVSQRQPGALRWGAHPKCPSSPSEKRAQLLMQWRFPRPRLVGALFCRRKLGAGKSAAGLGCITFWV